MRDGICECGCGQKTSVAPQTISSLGVRKGEPMRFLPGHNLRSRGHRGQLNPAWKGGRYISHGYVFVWQPDGREAREHRVVMERVLGRSLAPNEVVHHRNGDKTDNRPENLEVMTVSDHMRLHSSARSKIGADDVRDMRRRYRSEGISQVALAREYGLHPKHVGKIIRGEKWGHVD